MAKRGNGEGSIYQRKSDGKWVGSITLENRKRKVFYGDTRKEVQEKMKVALREQQQGTLITARQQSVKEYLEDWLENTHKRSIRPRSHERYEEIVRLHIVPAIGKVPLQKLTPQRVQRFYSDMLNGGYSSVTVNAVHNLLHKALDNAVRWELVAQNVCEKVSPPRKQRHEIRPLTPEQIHQLLDAARGHPQEALFILALATGMRRGELLGLKWQDISFTEGTLQVRRVLNRVPTKMVKALGQSYIEAEPKTEKSRRNIILAEFVLEALRQHRERQGELKRNAGAAWEEHDYVFCTPKGKHLHPGNDVLVPLKKLLQQAGLPDIRFHDLRHSAATMLLSMEVHPKVVQELLGHSQIGMTMDIYSHVLPTMQREAINKLNDALRRQEHDDRQVQG
jgi:integrase